MEVSSQLHYPSALYPWEKILDEHSIEDWVGPRCGLEAVEKRKIPCPCRESTRNSSAVQPVSRRCTD
jgi:hypothetical protein